MRFDIPEPNMFYMGVKNSKFTFDDVSVKAWVADQCFGNVLNCFAGMNVVVDHEYRVDINPDRFKLDYVGNVMDFFAFNDSEDEEDRYVFDTLIVDPDWNKRKSKEKYDGKWIGWLQRMKEDIARYARNRIIHAGYEISLFGQKRGFYISDILVCNPYGEIRPYFVTVEKKYK